MNMNTDVLSAFDLLLEAMGSEKRRQAEIVKEMVLDGHFSEAQRLLAKSERIERLIERVKSLREAWEQLDETAAEPPSIESELPKRRTTGISTGSEYAPELEIAKELFGGQKPLRRRQQQPVSKTPDSAYRIPILEVLEELGGSGKINEVLDRIYEKMKDHLTEDDLKLMPSGKVLRWRNTAAWERYNMVKEGLLSADSPFGMWEITEAGREYLQKARQEEKSHQSPQS